MKASAQMVRQLGEVRGMRNVGSSIPRRQSASGQQCEGPQRGPRRQAEGGLLDCPEHEHRLWNQMEEQAEERWGDQQCRLDFPGSRLGRKGRKQEPRGPRVSGSFCILKRERPEYVSRLRGERQQGAEEGWSGDGNGASPGGAGPGALDGPAHRHGLLHLLSMPWTWRPVLLS